MKTTNKIQICMAIFSLLFLCGASVSRADTFSVSINNNNLSPDGTRIVCFIVTHSQQVPVVAVANNDGFPTEKSVAASQNSYQGQDGINVSIVLSQAAPNAPSSAFIKLNISQDGAKEPYLIIPRPRQ